MKILVCIKQVPDMESVEFSRDEKVVERGFATVQEADG